ncbi:MAG: LysE/ArgO family amino acid transporter [Caldilineaceae bacterium]|nr:LysE/ArgO family amino acid transporter [Caldilineaceae bacterium]
MPPFSFTPFLQGFGLSAALIMAIGAQNAFVLQQGLRRQHVFATAAICALCDAALIVLGVAGLGAVITQSAQLTALATWGGAAFLFAYGARAFWSALRPGMLDAEQSTLRGGALATTVLAALGVSLLNPHVYLDTVVLVGSVGGRYPAGDRVAFAAGAMSASCVWFFGLAYGAAWLAPIFRRPRAWRLLDLAVGAIMWAIAASLIWG